MDCFLRKQCTIIAEAGVNHNGDMTIARKLIDAAAQSGADYVKFQTFSAEKLVTRTAQQAEYQKKNLQSDDNASQYDMLKKLELNQEQHYELNEYCKTAGVKFLSTAFDNESLEFLVQKMDVDYIKIPSGELTNYPYLKLAASLNKPIIISTGMAYLDEIIASVNLLKSFGMTEEKICILHCTTEYPALISEVNLKAMQTIKDATGCHVGYSDHTMGICIPIAAVALGATVVEKHFTLDRQMPGPDHPASLEPDELREMVISIRNVERAMGNGQKQPAGERELSNRAVARKSIVAACHIEAGESFTEANLTVKRPGTGISPMRWPEVIGKQAIRSFNENDLIVL